MGIYVTDLSFLLSTNLHKVNDTEGVLDIDIITVGLCLSDISWRTV